MFDFFDSEREYRKDNNLKKQDVQILIDWMEKQPHLPKITEFQIILFLQSCYHRIEPAKSAIDNYFTFRTMCPELCGKPDFPSFDTEMNVSSLVILPNLTPEGHRVYLMQLLDPNPDHYNFVNQIKNGDLRFTLNLHQEGTCNGIRAIFDMKNFSFAHLTKMSLVAMKKHFFYVQEAAPIRIKGVHYINIVPFMDKLMAIMKPLMKKELVEMIHIHPKNEDLYKFVPKEMLPKDYGGQAPPSLKLHEKGNKDLHENVEFFQWLDSLKVDENKRMGRPKNQGDLFGVDGTFKKLEVD